MNENGKKYQICMRCVMDTFDEFITFDERGYCNHCEAFIERAKQHNYVAGESEKQWEEILANIKQKGKGREYDCIVGISGGVDSSYTAYLCKEWGLRPLLMHMDNGWDTEISVKNIKTLAEKPNFEYVSYVEDWNVLNKYQIAFH